MDNLRESFQRVKQDMASLREEISVLKLGLIETREKLIELCEVIKRVDKKTGPKEESNYSTHIQENSTVSTHPSTHPSSFKPLNDQNLPISTGNRGVPTDRQTDRQTDQQTQKTQENPIDNAFNLLNSLDTLKKEIRLKFKRLTDQEMLVFSTIYQLEEEQGPIDYRTLANRLSLTESSVRDYVGRIIKKGISVDKTKLNNKTIQLSISQKLKQVAGLPTILQLREI